MSDNSFRQREQVFLLLVMGDLAYAFSDLQTDPDLQAWYRNLSGWAYERVGRYPDYDNGPPSNETS